MMDDGSDGSDAMPCGARFGSQGLLIVKSLGNQPTLSQASARSLPRWVACKAWAHVAVHLLPLAERLAERHANPTKWRAAPQATIEPAATSSAAASLRRSERPLVAKQVAAKRSAAHRGVENPAGQRHLRHAGKSKREQPERLAGTDSKRAGEQPTPSGLPCPSCLPLHPSPHHAQIPLHLRTGKRVGENVCVSNGWQSMGRAKERWSVHASGAALQNYMRARRDF